MTENEKTLFLIRNKVTRDVLPLGQESAGTHPAWVHKQLGTKSESELSALTEGLRLSDYLPAGRENEDARGIFVDIPNGALAWKLKDPFQSARWLFEESEVVEALELDPEIVLRVGGGAQD